MINKGNMVPDGTSVLNTGCGAGGGKGKPGFQKGNKCAKKGTIQGKPTPNYIKGIPTITTVATKDELHAAGLYQYASSDFNSYLENKPNDGSHLISYEKGVMTKIPYPDTASKLDSLLDKAVIKQDTNVYRGSFGDVPKTGDIFSPKQFLSTSLSEKEAVNFSKSSKTRDQLGTSWTMEITLPKGSKGVYIDVDSGDKKGVVDFLSKEVLLPRNLKYRVISVRGTKVKAELI